MLIRRPRPPPSKATVPSASVVRSISPETMLVLSVSVPRRPSSSQMSMPARLPVVTEVQASALCPLDPSLASRSQRIEIVAADADRLGADRERLQDMGPPLHPAIHEHVDPITYSVDDFGQLVE